MFSGCLLDGVPDWDRRTIAFSGFFWPSQTLHESYMSAIFKQFSSGMAAVPTRSVSHNTAWLPVAPHRDLFRRPGRGEGFHFLRGSVGFSLMGTSRLPPLPSFVLFCHATHPVAGEMVNPSPLNHPPTTDQQCLNKEFVVCLWRTRQHIGERICRWGSPSTERISHFPRVSEWQCGSRPSRGSQHPQQPFRGE